MPQVLKEEVRARILDAALEVFARHGFEGATLQLIAREAETGPASVYRYYAGKDALFDAVIPPTLALQFEALLEKRVRALAVVALGDGQGVKDDAGEEMLRFWIAHRREVVVLLDRAAGTAYAPFGERFVDLLTRASVAAIRRQRPGVRIGAPARFVLTRIFENTRRMLAALLAEHEDENALREAIRAFWSYQVPGLRGFADGLAQEPARPVTGRRN